MGFAKDVKDELLEREISDDCCCLAFLCGLIKSIGKIEIDNNESVVFLTTDVFGLFDYINKILKQLYGQTAIIEIVEKSIINKTTYYKIMFPKEQTKQILIDIGIAKLTSAGLEILEETDEHIFKSECCPKAYIKAVFLSCATTSIRISERADLKSTTGYHLEFTSHNKKFLSEFSEFLAKENILSKLAKRKNTYVLYLKNAQAICDLFALMGATEAVLSLQNEIASREIRNTVNRQTNCVSANISKTVDANLKQLEAIDIISETIGLDALPEELAEVALLRLANTEESLSELERLTDLKLTRSGLNHRLQKLIKIANELK